MSLDDIFEACKDMPSHEEKSFDFESNVSDDDLRKLAKKLNKYRLRQIQQGVRNMSMLEASALHISFIQSIITIRSVRV